jgi:PAS domain S-box-containing protein
MEAQACPTRRPSLMTAQVVSAASDVYSDLVARFLGDSPLAEIAHVALGLTVTLLLIGQHPAWALGSWLLALVVASYVRYTVRTRYARRAEPVEEIPRSVIATIVLVGLVWSVGAMPLLLAADPEVGLRVMIVECGLAAAATFTFAATKAGFRVFLASIFVPLIAGLLGHGFTRGSVTNALLVVVFGATMTALQARGNSQLTRSLQLNLDLERSREAAERGQVALRESERRLFQLLESMPVGVVVVDQSQKVYFSNAAAKSMVGNWLGEQPMLSEVRGRSAAFVPGTNQPLGPERSPVALALRGERSMEQIEINGPNGLRLIEIHGSPIRDSNGAIALAVAVLSDLTARQGGDQRRAAINAVLSVAADAESEDQLLENVLHLLTERFSFSLAELWMPTADGTTLRRVASKQRGDEERVTRFDQVSATLSFARGQGLPGRAWRTGEAIWRNRSAEDDETFRRPGGVVEAGLRTGVAVPVFVAGVASGALVLFTDDRREPDGPVIDTLMAIGAQVGGAITRRRAEATIRAAEERYRHLVEASTDLVWQVDLEGRWTFLNAASDRLFGLPPELMIGRYFTEWADPDHLEQDRAVLARILGGDVVTEYETVIRNVKGAPVVVSTSGAPVRDESGVVIGCHGILRDVGDRAAARAALRAARDAAEQAAAAKSAFLANMSHEIRTPMNGVLGVAELLQGTPLDAEQRRMVDLIATSGNALLDVINEILDFSKIEAHQLEIESAEFELHELVESTVQLVASGARNPEVEVITDVASDVPTHVMGDATRLRQVLSNLVGNALKFTHKGEVVVTVERVAALGRTARLRFRVRDTGIGMTPDTLAAIFEPFRQADSSTTRRYGGTGLGLTISQRLVELMGGALDVSSDQGSGSSFSFELNLPIVTTPSAVAEPA